ESLVIASFVRGLSVRDVEATLADALGDQAAISKSTVSAVCGQIKEEYQAWAARRLDDVMLDYLFLDASFFRMHPDSPAEPVLAAWRSEEHTSELQSRGHLVCRLLLEKKKAMHKIVPGYIRLDIFRLAAEPRLDVHLDDGPSVRLLPGAGTSLESPRCRSTEVRSDDAT